MGISVDDFILFSERTIAGMRESLRRLDDETVNVQPPLPAPNSPYQLVHHALSACDWWTSHIICGHPTDRARDAEFESTGTVDDLLRQADELVARLHERRDELATTTELANIARTKIPLADEWTVGGAMIHAYEELAQHLGHLEITVDLVERRSGE